MEQNLPVSWWYLLGVREEILNKGNREYIEIREVKEDDELMMSKELLKIGC